MTTRSQRLDSVADIYMGQAPSGEAYNSEGEGWPLLAGAGDFKDGLPAAKKFTREAPRTCIPGDIVIGVRASIGDKVVADREYCLGRGVAALRPRSGLHNRYLWHWLSVTRQKLEGKGKGATFKQVTKEDVAELEIPLPPLEEQRRIAAILDKASSIKSCNEKAIKKLADIKISLFDKTFIIDGQLDGWKQLELGELCDVQGGLQVTSARGSLPIRVPYLRVANVLRGRLDLSEIKEINCTQAELDRTRLRPKDLLVVEGHGNPGEIGRVAMWDQDGEAMVHQNHLIRVRSVAGSLDPGFLCFYLNSRLGRRHLLKRANTTSGLNTISASVVKSAPVIIPPIARQSEFLAAIKRINELEISLFAGLALHAQLFASLLGETL